MAIVNINRLINIPLMKFKQQKTIITKVGRTCKGGLQPL